MPTAGEVKGGVLRKALDGLYTGAAWLAALAIVGLFATVLLSIVSRQLGFHARGVDSYAGYLMAGAGFLALAHTLKAGEHIRVTLLLQVLRGRARFWLEVWALGAATLLAGLFAWYSVRLAWQSHALNDISTGNDATPLWIPQLAMAAGTIVLLVAFVDELVATLAGHRPVERAAGGEATRHE
jgi:TRAP-type C4-dicarboxylate transport system permease small subunit